MMHSPQWYFASSIIISCSSYFSLRLRVCSQCSTVHEISNSSSFALWTHHNLSSTNSQELFVFFSRAIDSTRGCFRLGLFTVWINILVEQRRHPPHWWRSVGRLVSLLVRKSVGRSVTTHFSGRAVKIPWDFLLWHNRLSVWLISLTFRQKN